MLMIQYSDFEEFSDEYRHSTASAYLIDRIVRRETHSGGMEAEFSTAVLVQFRRGDEIHSINFNATAVRVSAFSEQPDWDVLTGNAKKIETAVNSQMNGDGLEINYRHGRYTIPGIRFEDLVATLPPKEWLK